MSFVPLDPSLLSWSSLPSKNLQMMRCFDLFRLFIHTLKIPMTKGYIKTCVISKKFWKREGKPVGRTVHFHLIALRNIQSGSENASRNVEDTSIRLLRALTIYVPKLIDKINLSHYAMFKWAVWMPRKQKAKCLHALILIVRYYWYRKVFLHEINTATCTRMSPAWQSNKHIEHTKSSLQNGVE